MAKILGCGNGWWNQTRIVTGKFKQWLLMVVAAMVFASPLNVSAAAIFSQSMLVTGNQWINVYTITAGAGDAPVEEFTIFFDPACFANLALVSSPFGWDVLVVQPDSGIPADGLFDALALGRALDPGETLGGFAVSFDYLGSGIPSRQRFDIVDPVTFATIQSGFTSAESVPEPRALALLALGFCMLAFSRRSFFDQWRGSPGIFARRDKGEQHEV